MASSLNKPKNRPFSSTPVVVLAVALRDATAKVELRDATRKQGRPPFHFSAQEPFCHRNPL